MAAEVSSSSLVRVLSGHIDEQSQIHSGNSDILITKDLLGSLSKAATKDIDLEFKPGKLQTQIGNSPKSPLSSASTSPASYSPDAKNKNRTPNPFQEYSKLQDLNFPPNPINFFEDTSLELKLQSSNSSTPSSSYHSVCTLDKVKFALERAEKETMKKRSSSPPTISSTSATPTKSSSDTPAMFAAACPGCLLYVIASKTNPRCPRCNSHVPSTFTVKKPRIDLNASF